MNNPLIVWGLVFLVGMVATHFLVIDPHFSGINLQTAWIGWLVIFFFGNLLVGRSMKKTPRNIGHMWMVVNILGALLTIAFLTDTIAFNAAHIMAIWFFIMGAAVYAGAHERKDPEGVFVGFLWVAVGILTPLIFADVPFLIGGLVFGLPFVIGGLLKK